MSERYELEAWREPKRLETDELIRSEHGRIAYNIDYRSHWLTLVKGEHRHYAILVKHGGGEERLELTAVNASVIAGIIAALSSDEAYLLMYKMIDIHKAAAKTAMEETATKYRAAFVDGRLKKRKLPAQGVTKVWIDDRSPEAGGQR